MKRLFIPKKPEDKIIIKSNEELRSQVEKETHFIEKQTILTKELLNSECWLQEFLNENGDKIIYLCKVAYKENEKDAILFAPCLDFLKRISNVDIPYRIYDFLHYDNLIYINYNTKNDQYVLNGKLNKPATPVYQDQNLDIDHPHLPSAKQIDGQILKEKLNKILSGQKANDSDFRLIQDIIQDRDYKIIAISETNKFIEETFGPELYVKSKKLTLKEKSKSIILDAINTMKTKTDKTLSSINSTDDDFGENLISELSDDEYDIVDLPELTESQKKLCEILSINYHGKTPNIEIKCISYSSTKNKID
jgi:hypothetical protein